MDIAKKKLEEEKRLLQLKQKLKQGIERNIPDIHINGHPDDCLPGTLNISFDGVEGVGLVTEIALLDAGAALSGDLLIHHRKMHHEVAGRRLVALVAVL